MGGMLCISSYLYGGVFFGSFIYLCRIKMIFMMTTLEIEIALMDYFDFTRNYIIPGIRRSSGLLLFETDMFILTFKGYGTGIEIKVSKNDLFKDFKKRHVKYFIEGKDFYYRYFKYFYYALDSSLLKYSDSIPKEFGILECFKKNKKFIVSVFRKPKHLNNYKFSDKEIKDFLRLGTMRIYNLKKNLL